MILQPSRSTHLPYTALFRSLPLYLKGAGRSTLARPWFEWSVPVIALATRAGRRSRGAIGKRFGVRALIAFFFAGAVASSAQAKVGAVPSAYSGQRVRRVSLSDGP